MRARAEHGVPEFNVLVLKDRVETLCECPNVYKRVPGPHRLFNAPVARQLFAQRHDHLLALGCRKQRKVDPALERPPVVKQQPPTRQRRSLHGGPTEYCQRSCIFKLTTKLQCKRWLRCQSSGPIVLCRVTWQRPAGWVSTGIDVLVRKARSASLQRATSSIPNARQHK